MSRLMRIMLCGSLFILMSCGKSAIDQGLREVTEESLRHHIAVLSDDSLAGRGPSTKGDLLATSYIASEFKAMGLEPAGENNSFFQQVPMIGISIKPLSLDFKKGGKSVSLKFIDDFVAFSGVQDRSVVLKDIEVVFVGYGIEAPEQNWDDYKGYDVKGKILLMLNDDPPSEDPAFFGGKGRTYYGRWTYKFEIAARKGAIGAIILHTTPSAGYPFQVWQGSWSREQFDLEGDASSPLKLKGATSEEATKRYITLAGLDLSKLQQDATQKSFKPVSLGIKLSANMSVSARRLETKNVVGILRGSDPELSKQYVVFSAHHDHLGVGRPVEGDSVYNGALDNASGLSMMLNMAKAFSAMAPRPGRSLVFAAVAAEEYGLLGSQYYAGHPTVPLKDIAANINTDGLNIWGKTSDITFLGWERSSLKEDVEAVAGEMGMTISEDAYPEKGFFYRSDHFNFAKVGVPSLSYEVGNNFIGKPVDYSKQVKAKYEEQNYHQPSDEFSKDWVFDGGMKDCEFIIRLASRIANKSTLPTWRQGDEFEAARLKTLGKM